MDFASRRLGFRGARGSDFFCVTSARNNSGEENEEGQSEGVGMQYKQDSSFQFSQKIAILGGGFDTGRGVWKKVLRGKSFVGGGQVFVGIYCWGGCGSCEIGCGGCTGGCTGVHVVDYGIEREVV